MPEMRREEFVLGIAWDVWPHATNLSRVEIFDAFMEALPAILADQDGDEGAALDRVVDLSAVPSGDAR